MTTNYVIFKLMMLFKSGIKKKQTKKQKKNMLVVSYIKILHHIFIPTIYENFNQFFYLSRTNGNFETCMPFWFEQLKELKQSWGTFTGSYF